MRSTNRERKFLKDSDTGGADQVETRQKKMRKTQQKFLSKNWGRFWKAN